MERFIDIITMVFREILSPIALCILIVVLVCAIGQGIRFFLIGTRKDKSWA